MAPHIILEFFGTRNNTTSQLGTFSETLKTAGLLPIHKGGKKV